MQGYKVVIKLKNGARVSCLIPKEMGMRKTYHANGQSLLVDEGMIFNTYNAARDMLYQGFYNWWESGTELEIWACNYTDYGTQPTHILGMVSNLRKQAKNIIKLVGTLFASKGDKAKIARNKLYSLGVSSERYIGNKSWPEFPLGTVFARNITLGKMVYSCTI